MESQPSNCMGMEQAMNAFEAGKQAYLEGKTLADNPHTCGFTKLGNLKLTEEGIEWEAGFKSAAPARVASDAEMQAARKVDVSRFKRKSNKYYQGQYKRNPNKYYK